MAFILFVFSGCSVQSGDSLLMPPSLPVEYIELEKQLNAILETGAQYITPEVGTERQSVKLIDLDADSYNEAVAFFMMADGTLRVYVFEYDSGVYSVAGYIEGTGARRLYSVEFRDYAPGGWMYIAVSWSYDETENRGLTFAYYGGRELETILQTMYKSILYMDINGSGAEEIFTVTVNDVTGAHRMRMFSKSADGTFIQSVEAPLCSEVREVVSMQYDAEGLLFIDSAAKGGGYVTDVIKWNLTTNKNLTVDEETGSGRATFRQAEVFCTDIDGDGYIEIPSVDAENGRIEWYGIPWRGYLLSEEKKLTAETYHSIVDGWYILWPERWQDNVSAHRTAGNGVDMTTFYVPAKAGTGSELRNALLTVYVFSGDRSAEVMKSYSGVRVLNTVGNTIYAYSAMPNDFPEYSLSDAEISRIFGIIEAANSVEGN